MISKAERKVDGFRLTLGSWIADFDTRLLEFFIALISMVNGFAALAILPDGRPAAPNLNATLSFMSLSPAQWSGALMATGALILVSLCLGTRRPETTWPRAWVMGLAMAYYIAIFTGSLSQPGGLALASRFGVTAAACFFCCVVLTVEAMVQQHTVSIEDHSATAIDRATVARVMRNLKLQQQASASAAPEADRCGSIH